MRADQRRDGLVDVAAARRERRDRGVRRELHRDQLRERRRRGRAGRAARRELQRALRRLPERAERRGGRRGRGVVAQQLGVSCLFRCSASSSAVSPFMLRSEASAPSSSNALAAAVLPLPAAECSRSSPAR